MTFGAQNVIFCIAKLRVLGIRPMGKHIKTVEKLVVKILNKHRGKTGNVTILRDLKESGVNESEYKKAKENLREAGKITLGKGKGGSVSLADSGEILAKPEIVPVPAKISVSKHKKFVMKRVPKDGTPIGNIALIKELRQDGISEDEYWPARNELIIAGDLSKGRGKGGAVFRPIDTLPTGGKIDPKYKTEKSIYPDFHNVIAATTWLGENLIDPKTVISEITANQGRKRTGGKWSRPDVTLIVVEKYRFIPEKVLTVMSFEIKKANELDVSGVYETASHSRFAHKSYLALYLPGGIPERDYSYIHITQECERFGVGLIIFQKPNDATTYDTVIEPRRKNPDPADVDLFIFRQFQKKHKDLLRLL